MSEEPIPDTFLEKLIASIICIILCGFIGALGVEIFKFSLQLDFSTFWQSFLLIISGAVTIIVFFAAICCLISSVGIWMPGNKDL